MDDTTEMVDLTSDQYEPSFDSQQSHAAPNQPITGDGPNQIIDSRLQYLAKPRKSDMPPADKFRSFKKSRGLGQHAKSSPRLYEHSQPIKQEGMSHNISSSIEDPSPYNAHLASNATRHRSNDTFRPPSEMGESILHRPNQHIDIDMVDNERGPVRSDYQTPTHPSRADHNGLFVTEDEDFPMDHTPTQKRRRVDSAHGYGEQRQPSVANMTPSSSSRNRQPSSSRPSSSSRSQLGLMGAQARSQINGGQPLFNTPSSSRLSNFHVVPSRTQATSRAPNPPGVVTEDDLRQLFLELSTQIKTYQRAITQLLQSQQNFNTMKAAIEQEQKEQNDHMNKTLQEFADKNKKAIAELHETNEYLQHQIDQITKNYPNRTPPHGGAYGGSGLGQAPNPSPFAGMLNPDAQQRTQSRAPTTPGPNR